MLLLMIRPITIALISLAQVAGHGAGSAPADNAADRNVPTTVKMVGLMNANAAEVSHLLPAAVRGLSAVADERTNSLLLGGTQAKIDDAMNLLKELDRPVDRAGARIIMAAVKNRPARDIAQRILEVMSRGADARDMRVATDEPHGTILLNGSDAVLKAAESIIRELDVPAPAVRLEFSLLHARLPGATGATGDASEELPGTAVPPDLKDVSTELERYGQLRLLGRFATTAVESQTFQLQGLIASQFMVKIGGQIRHAAGSGAVRVEVKADMEFNGDKQRAPQSLMQVQTQVSAARDSTVVIGTVPSGWKAGESAILVVRIGK